MTDNCAELHEALLRVWPSVLLLLCTFHILQQVWRWLGEKKNCIPIDKRPELLLLFKRMVYSENAEMFQECYNIFLDEVSKYPNYRGYIVGLCKMKERWAHYNRRNKSIRGNHTNNFVESQFNILKDIILRRTKEFNINGLLEKLLIDFDAHYENKLSSVANGSFDGVYRSRFMGKKKTKKHKERVGYYALDD